MSHYAKSNKDMEARTNRPTELQWKIINEEYEPIQTHRGEYLIVAMNIWSYKAPVY